MLERVLIAGSGGQGVLLCGKLLAAAAIDYVPHVTFFPAYGAEVRGGTSHGEVILSSDPIASPVSEVFDAMILMNQASLDRFAPLRKPQALVLANSSLCNVNGHQDVLQIRATELADEVGTTRAANLIMLGAYLARRDLIPAKRVEDMIQTTLTAKGTDVVDLNLCAFRMGLEM